MLEATDESPRKASLLVIGAPDRDVAELLESLENIDMLLANMRAGGSQREDAIQRLGDKFDVFGEQDAKQRLRDEDTDSRPT